GGDGGVEQWPGGGAGEPAENDQAADVRAGRVLPAAGPGAQGGGEPPTQRGAVEERRVATQGAGETPFMACGVPELRTGYIPKIDINTTAECKQFSIWTECGSFFPDTIRTSKIVCCLRKRCNVPEKTLFPVGHDATSPGRTPQLSSRLTREGAYN